MEIIKKRQDIIENSVEEFSSSIPAIQKDIWSNFLTFIGQLDIVNGQIKASAKNIKSVTRFTNIDVKKIINRTDYKDAMNQFVGTFDTTAKLTDKYFEQLAK